MGGLLVLVLVAGYVWGAARFFKYVGPSWSKALVVVAAILIPTAEAVYGRIKLKQMCQKEGGGIKGWQPINVIGTNAANSDFWEVAA